MPAEPYRTPMNRPGLELGQDGLNPETWENVTRKPETDILAPVLSFALVSGNPLIMEFSEELDADFVPATTAFDVQKNGGSAAITSIAVVGTTVKLTMTVAIVQGDTLTAAYTRPTANTRLRDAASNEVNSFTAQTVLNYTAGAADTTAPRFSFAIVNTVTIRMIYDEPLDTASIPATTAFSIVINGGASANPSGVDINGNTVVLTHLSTLVSTDTVTVAYTAPGSNMIQDLAGNDAATLGAQTCVNVSESARVYKSANEIVNNSAALQNDNHLTFACQANKSYRVKLFGRFSSSVTADIKLDLSVPAGASHQMLGVTQAGGGTIIALDVTLSGSGVGTILSFILEGVVIVGGTAGSVTFQWAQNVAEVSDTTVYKDSYLLYELLN